MELPTVSNVVEISGKKRLRIDFRAYRKLEDWELRRHLAFFLGSKQGKKAVRSGGQVIAVTTIGADDPINPRGEWR